MTENEAIEYLQNRYLVVGSPANPPKEECEKHNAVMTMAIQALEEVQQYRAIGTPEECRTAMEKQIPKRPIKDKKQGIRYTSCYECPSCHKGFAGTGIADYCYHCGQRIEWRSNDEKID